MVSDPMEVCNMCSYKEICRRRKSGKLCEDYSPCPPMSKTIPPKTDLSKDKYISANLLKDEMCAGCVPIHEDLSSFTGMYGGKETIAGYIDSIPPADVVEVVHAHIVWRKRHKGGFQQRKCLCENVCLAETIACKRNAIVDDRYIIDEPYCSECGKLLGDFINYCGNCGARMDGVKGTDEKVTANDDR